MRRSLVFRCEAVPVDFHDVGFGNLLAVDRTHSLTAAERLLDAFTTGHVAALEHDGVLSLLANQTEHLFLPVLILELDVLLVARISSRSAFSLASRRFHNINLVFVRLAFRGSLGYDFKTLSVSICSALQTLLQLLNFLEYLGLCLLLLLVLLCYSPNLNLQLGNYLLL